MKRRRRKTMDYGELLPKRIRTKVVNGTDRSMRSRRSEIPNGSEKAENENSDTESEVEVKQEQPDSDEMDSLNDGLYEERILDNTESAGPDKYQKQAELDMLRFIEIWREGYDFLRKAPKKYTAYKELTEKLHQRYGISLTPEKFQNRVQNFTKRYRCEKKMFGKKSQWIHFRDIHSFVDPDIPMEQQLVDVQIGPKSSPAVKNDLLKMYMKDSAEFQDVLKSISENNIVLNRLTNRMKDTKPNETIVQHFLYFVGSILDTLEEKRAHPAMSKIINLLMEEKTSQMQDEEA